MKITERLWHIHEDKEIFLFTLSNDHIEVGVTNLGCIVTSIKVKGNNYKDRNIVLGYNSAEEYIKDPYFIGCIIGRFAGRIKDSAFTINNIKYNLSPNEKNTGNHLHGGHQGFNKKISRVAGTGSDNHRCFVKMETKSPHLEEGYPGELQTSVTIELNNENEISITYEAVTDRPTHVSLTHHHYFNLNGEDRDGTGQQLEIYADKYLEQDDQYIPGGSLRPVTNTRNDFTRPKIIKDIKGEKVYNEYFVLNKTRPSRIDAVLSVPSLRMDISTTYPCIVFYSADFLDRPFYKSQGICLETQYFPGIPNLPGLPSTLLKPGNIYFHRTKMKITLCDT